MAPNHPHIVITGAGIVSAIGMNQEETLQSLLNAQSGIAPVQYLATDHKDTLVGEVKASNAQLQARLGFPSSAEVPRGVLMGMLALQEALTQAQLPLNTHKNFPLISGTTVGGMDKGEQNFVHYFEDHTWANTIREQDCGASTEAIADHFGGFAFCTTLSTACSSAANAFALGMNLLQSGEYDQVVVGGNECLSKFHLNGFKTLMIVDAQPCRPFDAHRAGLNLGEGAAYLVLETEAAARARGVTPLARFLSYGNACDAYHQTASSPEGDGAYLAMKQALDRAGIAPSEIDYINAHGTGTPNNDASECAAMSRLFGEHLPPFLSTKSYTGHTTSASGSIEAVICLLSLQHQFIPASLHYSTPINPAWVPNTDVKKVPLHYVLCNSFGFGGNDTSILLAP